jgi:hypothetical protein
VCIGSATLASSLLLGALAFVDLPVGAPSVATADLLDGHQYPPLFRGRERRGFLVGALLAMSLSSNLPGQFLELDVFSIEDPFSDVGLQGNQPLR